jgi:glycosyltransferase involved in cell wall biosynthesis
MALPIDAIYFLLFPGWRNEVQYDPWHYAQRWARDVPVVLVQPELPPGAPVTSEPERRLENVEILSIEEQTYPACLPTGIVQSRQILEFMAKQGHSRPILWFYNPSLMFAYALVPAVSRTYFGNENYLEVKDEPELVDLARAALAISDKIICGSEAMFDTVRAETERSDIAFIPNGCEYERYSKATPVRSAWTEILRPILASGTPIAVFAGSINNWRLDFAFLDGLAQSLAQLHFVYAGPVQFTKDEDRDAWERVIQRPNVSYLGFLDPADLPWLYRFADRGFMPYRQLPIIRKNPIPLKSLEMAAAGLPVVSMAMDSLAAISDAVEVAADEADFIEKLRRISRRTRSPEAAARADALCREYDYDRLFARALDVMREADLERAPRPAPLAPLYDILGADRMLRDLRPPPPPAPAAAGLAAAPARDASLAERPPAYPAAARGERSERRQARHQTAHPAAAARSSLAASAVVADSAGRRKYSAEFGEIGDQALAQAVRPGRRRKFEHPRKSLHRAGGCPIGEPWPARLSREHCPR